MPYLPTLRIHIPRSRYDNTAHRVNYFYPSMTMFALPFKSWVAVTANGTEVSGTFLKDDSFTLQSAIQWGKSTRNVALFVPRGSL